MRLLGFMLAAAFLGVACGDDEGNDPECIEKYDLVVDGASCDENGDSRDCGPLKCSCPGAVTSTAYICFEGRCVTAIEDCDAWCGASEQEQFACF